MLKRNIYKIVAVLLTAGMIFCGCGQKKNSTTQEKNNNDATITMQMRNPSTLNPLKVENQSVRDALSLCYEPLFVINDSLIPEGVLAKNIIISDDCKSAVITLKDSILWHDEIRFTSADVVHTINLLMEDKYSEYSHCVKHIESVQSVDPLTLRITMSRPYGQLAYSLYFPIVSAHNDKLDENIVGTGAYMTEKYTPSVALELKKFNSWHGGEALCEKVNISVMRDVQTATTSFNAGIINAVTGKSFDLENKTPKANARITLYPSSEYEYIAFNHNNKFLSSQSIRSAISCAIDRNAIVQECYAGAAQAANVPLHPQSEKMAASSLSVQYNLASASEMLFLEGFSLNENTLLLQNKNGEKLSFTLLVNSENQSRLKCASLLQTQLFASGIQMTIKELDFDEYTKAIKAGNYDAYLGGTRLGNIYDFEFMFSEDGNLNDFGYFGEYMNLAMSAIASAPTEDALSDAVFNFEEVFLREQPVCGLVFKKESLITSDAVMGKLLPQMYFPYRNIANWSLIR